MITQLQLANLEEHVAQIARATSEALLAAADHEGADEVYVSKIETDGQYLTVEIGVSNRYDAGFEFDLSGTDPKRVSWPW